ncbi:MAG: DUF3574 domain-containing protein [Erysipelotrichaceae bacterium]|nr:DUF3574 domain-containing protein [Erysipelotrichaceae bacterium]
MEKSRQAMIYIGLNDSKTHEQIYDTERYIGILKNVCKSYHVAFSMNEMNGGYFHEDGTYVEEKSLVITLLGAKEETVREIAKDLCAFFHQESVMVTFTEAEVCFIEERLPEL